LIFSIAPEVDEQSKGKIVMKKISIIGSGAIGKTYGGLLALAGHQVHFLTRSEYGSIKKAEGFSIILDELDKTLSIHSPFIYAQSQDLPLSEVVIIALKTTENDKIETLLTSCLKKDSIILVIQNGIGNEEWVARFTGKRSLICGVTTMGAIRESPIHVKIPFLGSLKLAPFKKEYKNDCDVISALFKASPIKVPITTHDNYREIRWLKLTWNIPFGALSLIFDKTTNILAKEEPYFTLLMMIIREIRILAKTEGVLMHDEYLDRMIKLTQESENYFPSLYCDFREGKPIEKQYLYDNVLSIAKENKIVVPLLTLMERALSMCLKGSQNASCLS